jgi:hypothetical protein
MNDMNCMNDLGVVAGPASGLTSDTDRLRGLAGTGFIATLAAMAATTLAAALAQAIGVPVLSEANTATTTAFLGPTPGRCDGDDPHPGAEPPHPDRLTIRVRDTVSDPRQ